MRRALPIAAALLTGLLATSACTGPLGAGRDADRTAGSTADDAVEVDVADTLDADAIALAALGLDPSDTAPLETALPDTDPVAAPTTSSGEKASPTERAKRGNGVPGRRKVRVYLRRNTLHGEAVVQTKDGPKTVAVQRGTVTAKDATTITVKSSDGYTATWTIGDPVRVAERGAKADMSKVDVGETVAVGGGKSDGKLVARLVVVPKS